MIWSMEVTIELRLRPETSADGVVHVDGTARLASGQELGFSGWMALLQLLEATLAEDFAA
jgi:hypothetical protein